MLGDMAISSNNCVIASCWRNENYSKFLSFPVVDLEGFLGFWLKPPLRFYALSWVVKFKYSNRAVRSRLSNRTVTSRCNNRYSIVVALLEMMCEKERKQGWWLVRKKKGMVKVDDPFFCSQLLAELNLRSSAEQKPPFKNPRSATVFLSYNSVGEELSKFKLFWGTVFMMAMISTQKQPGCKKRCSPV